MLCRSLFVFSGVRVAPSLVLYVCFVDRCLSFVFCTLCCLVFFDLRILITPLVSSSSSYIVNICLMCVLPLYNCKQYCSDCLFDLRVPAVVRHLFFNVINFHLIHNHCIYCLLYF